MKRLLPILITLLISIQSFSQDTDNALVLESFGIYKNAILNDKGELAADYVDSRTIKYYSDILIKIKTADSIEVNSMGIIDKLTVLSVRHRTPPEEILSFNGRDLFVYAIKSGMVGKNSVMDSSLGEVKVNGDFAKAEFISNGQKTPFYFHFYRENNIWKLDITNIFSLGAISLHKVIENSGETENNFIINILELVSGNKPTHKIWQPII